MMNFKIERETVMWSDKYRLKGIGAGISNGISWTWLGDFPTKKLAELMKKAIRTNTQVTK